MSEIKKEKFDKISFTKEYEKKVYMKVLLRVNKNTQKHIVDKLEKVDSKNGYIIKLIDDDIKKRKK